MITQQPHKNGAALERAPSLSEIGEALYGPMWVSPLARALGRDLRTVQRWNAGQYQPSSATMRTLVAMLERRLAATNDVLARGRAMVAYFDEIRR